jgi:hypothetical protein
MTVGFMQDQLLVCAARDRQMERLTTTLKERSGTHQRKFHPKTEASLPHCIAEDDCNESSRTDPHFDSRLSLKKTQIINGRTKQEPTRA